MRLELSRTGSDQPIRTVEKLVSSDREATPEGENNLGIELAAEFRKAIHFHEYFAEIPDATVDLFDSRPRKFDFTKATSEWWDVLIIIHKACGWKSATRWPMFVSFWGKHGHTKASNHRKIRRIVAPSS